MNDLAREQHCRAIDSILMTAQARRAALAPPPNPQPVEEVSEDEFKMLQKATAQFEESPGLQATYKTAEAFGRHCLKAVRKENL